MLCTKTGLWYQPCRLCRVYKHRYTRFCCVLLCKLLCTRTLKTAKRSPDKDAEADEAEAPDPPKKKMRKSLSPKRMPTTTA